MKAPKLLHIPLYSIIIHRNRKSTLQSRLLDLTNMINRDTSDSCELVLQPIQPRPIVTKKDKAPPKKPRGQPKKDPSLPRHDVPRPEYLQGVTMENYGDFSTKCALRIYEDGKLSPKPCRRVCIPYLEQTSHSRCHNRAPLCQKQIY